MPNCYDVCCAFDATVTVASVLCEFRVLFQSSRYIVKLARWAAESSAGSTPCPARTMCQCEHVNVMVVIL
eukprot:14947-Heterococcus_DN1.PRE.1